MPLFNQLHPDWQVELNKHKELIAQIDREISGRDIAPSYEKVLTSLSTSIEEVRVVIFGQDPYPTRGHAHGYAFSVGEDVEPLPPSLRNIFKELESDLGVKRVSGDLRHWRDQGVLLINRILSTEVGTSKSHENLGWQEITNSVAEVLGQRDVVAVLWGSSAQELRRYFREEFVISSVHPSPLSAYRGFFGSRPFSQVNSKLIENGFSSISW